MKENKTYNLLSEELFEGTKHHAEIEIVDSNIRDSSIFIDGYKHSMVGVIAITIAAKKKTIINNPPLVSDTYVFIALINELGGKAHILNDKLYIDASNILSNNIPAFLSRCIHGSLYMCPALLVANGSFWFYGAGGCQIGTAMDDNKRPISHIMSVMEEFGGEISIDKSVAFGKLPLLRNIYEIDITRYSTNPQKCEGPLVGGATKTAIIMSVLCHKKLVIKNAYLKTDVLDMLRFLRKLGKDVIIEDTNVTICEQQYILGNKEICFTLTQCVSEIITYGVLAVASNKNISFPNLNKNVLEFGLRSEIELLRKMGVECFWKEDTLYFRPGDCINSCNIEVVPNGIQSDHHPFFVILLLLSNRQAELTEYVWKERFMYVENLKKLGADIYVNENRITVFPSVLTPTNIDLPSMDVRSAATSLLAMILSKSPNILTEAEHLIRGYSRLKEKLEVIGVKINIEYF